MNATFDTEKPGKPEKQTKNKYPQLTDSDLHYNVFMKMTC